MKCHYEVLGLERDCEDGAIKKAYRKAALVWHPDKNQHRYDEAEERFKEISNAYEVLSDPHERSWYDSHRDAILRSGERHQTGGGAEFAGGKCPEDDIDLFQFFSPSAFSGYNDGPKGFYTVYANLFAKLAEQEQKAAGGGRSPSLPTFGLSAAAAGEVTSFYSQWGAFATVKDFAWADQYNPASAPNRQVRRRMEEENKKSRKSARRECNDTVRELVAFVKKRDKRLIVIQQAEAAKKAEREAAEAERRRLAREERQAKASTYVEADWITASEQEAICESEESEEEAEVEYYCVVCEKKFKNPRALANHENSKKHQAKLADLRAALEEEEELLAELGIDDGSNTADSEDSEGADAGSDEQGEDATDGARVPEKLSGAESAEEDSDMEAEEEKQDSEQESEEEEEEEEEDDSEEAMLARMMGAHSARRQAADSAYDSNSEEDEEEEEEEEAMLARMMGAHSVRRQQKPSSSSEDGSEEEEDAIADTEGDAQDGAACVEAAEETDVDVRDDTRPGVDARGDAAPQEDEDEMLARLVQNSCKPSSGWQRATPGSNNGTAGTEAVDEDLSRGGEPYEGGCPAGKRGKGNKGKGKKSRVAEADAELACSICRKEFASRNQLFKHIKETGHAALRR